MRDDVGPKAPSSIRHKTFFVVCQTECSWGFQESPVYAFEPLECSDAVDCEWISSIHSTKEPSP